MTVSVPDYFNTFHCVAGACTDSCCRAGWEIPLDHETYRYYKGSALNIDENTYIDPDGDRVFKLNEDKSCVYLREDGLCSLYIKTGGRICDICTKYPRFFEEYDGFTEAGLAVSCPVAAELILSQRDNPYGDLSRDTDDELLAFLIEARKRAMAMIYGEKSPERAAELLLGYGLDLQELIDFDELERLPELEFIGEELYSDEEIRLLRGFISEKTEILSQGWRELLSKEITPCRGSDRQRRNYLAYLTYRYFLKAINTEDIAAQCRFIAAMYLIACSLDCGFGEAVKILCREIEHDLDNVDAVILYLNQQG